MEPQDVATLAGGSLIIHCQAQGFPQPQIMWMRGQGNGKRNNSCLYFIASIWHVIIMVSHNYQNLILEGQTAHSGKWKYLWHCG